MADNGRLPQSSLGRITNAASGEAAYLRKDAARAFNAMNAESERRFGTTLRATSGRTAYRTYAAQMYFWNLYITGRGNLAARPGTSNHGWGIAVDFASPKMRWIVDRIGAKYGFAKRWSDAPSEWWHIRFDPSHVTADLTPFKPLRYRSQGKRVAYIQYKLRMAGYKGVPAKGKDGRGFYGKSTKAAVRRFQRKHHLSADGIVGEKTFNALKRVKPRR